MKFFLLPLLSVFMNAGVATPVYDGNAIPEPELKDYSVATRTPGIMGAAVDILDIDGNPVSVQ